MAIEPLVVLPALKSFFPSFEPTLTFKIFTYTVSIATTAWANCFLIAAYRQACASNPSLVETMRTLPMPPVGLRIGLFVGRVFGLILLPFLLVIILRILRLRYWGW